MQILLRAFLILLILTIAAALFIVLYKRMRPGAQCAFYLPKLRRGNNARQMGAGARAARAGNRLLQCPACGKFSYMSPVWDAQ